MEFGTSMVVNHIDIEKIRKIIEGPVEDARLTAWLELYQASHEELERIVSGNDPILKILFLRFLRHVHEERAVVFIRDLLKDTSPHVHENAKRAFEKNQFPEKLRLLLPLLKISQKNVLTYVIEKLSLGGVHQAVDDLLRLASLDHEPDMTLKILTALRHLPDRRTLNVILPYKKSERSEVRLAIVHILGSLHESKMIEVRQHLLECLNDNDSQIRQSTLWVLQKIPHVKNIEIFKKFSKEDSHENVRQEAIQALKDFPTPQVIEHLIIILTQEKNRLVTLKAEGVLMSMPPPLLVLGLKKTLSINDKKIHGRTIMLLAEFQRGSKNYNQHLLEEFEASFEQKDPIVLLPIIEALGTVGMQTSIPFLEKCLHDTSIISYAAMAALLKITQTLESVKVLEYLESPSLSTLLKQMIFKNIIKRGSHIIRTQNDLKRFLKFLESDNLNIRYLAAQALFITGQESTFEPLLQTLFTEKDPTLLKFLKQSISSMIKSNLSLVIQVMKANPQNKEKICYLFQILEHSHLSSDQIHLMIEKLLSPEMSFLWKDYIGELKQFLAYGMIYRKATLETVFSHADTEQKKINLLQLFMNDYKNNSAMQTPMELLESWFHEASPSLQKVILEFLCSSPELSLPFLIKTFVKNKNNPVHEETQAAIQKIWRNPHPLCP